VNKNFKQFFKEIWTKLPDKRLFKVLSGSLLAVIAVEVVATVLIPDTKQYFYDIIENKDAANFIWGLLYFTGVLFVYGLCQGYKGWLGGRLALDLRTGITKVLLKKWVKGDNDVALADQRIQEDAKLCTELTIRVFLEVVISALIVIGLVGSVWGNWPVFFASFGYAGLVVLVAYLFKKPMVTSEIGLQIAEGHFRTSLTKIGMGQGDFTSKPLYEAVKSSYVRLIGILRNYTLFNRTKGALSNIVPFVILTPSYFAGEISLGDLMQAVAVFDLLVINSTILVLYYADVTKASASWKRVVEFRRRLK
jgi:vitamin B12/bleomycin/antimicrobial peptide transport system ATP-binding/permease protein